MENNNNKKLVTLQIEKELYSKIEEIANNEDRSVSSVIRKALKEYIKNKEENNG